MNFFEHNKSEDYTIIIGCGSLGANLANTLSNEGENVLIMDENKNAFRRLSASYGGLSIQGNGTDFNTLKEAKIHQASTLIALTNDDNTNIVIAQIARDMFHVNRVIARLYDPECESVYQEFGIDTICPYTLSAKEIDKLLKEPENKEVL